VLVGLLVPAPRPAQAEEEPSVQPEQSSQQTIDRVVEAGEADTTPPRRHWVKFNEFDGPYSTFRWGFGFLTDFLETQQDQDSKQQFDMSSSDSYGLRDFRLLFSGRFKTKRPISWTLGYMYDGADKSWRFRQTGFMIGLPEIDSRLFLVARRRATR
jgi:phosphate-selective porin OprO/OprP